MSRSFWVRTENGPPLEIAHKCISEHCEHVSALNILRKWIRGAMMHAVRRKSHPPHWLWIMSHSEVTLPNSIKFHPISQKFDWISSNSMHSESVEFDEIEWNLIELTGAEFDEIQTNFDESQSFFTRFHQIQCIRRPYSNMWRKLFFVT